MLDRGVAWVVTNVTTTLIKTPRILWSWGSPVRLMKRRNTNENTRGLFDNDCFIKKIEVDNEIEHIIN